MFIIKLVIVCIKVAWSCAYCASTVLIFGKLIYKRNFHQIGCGNVRASMRCTLSVGRFLTLRHFTNEGPAISPSDNVMASILSYFRMTFANCCNKVSPFQSIQLFSTFPSPSPAFLLYTNVPRTSIPKRTFFNFMIDKLPFFFDFDRNKVTSLMLADFPTILLTSSPFQKYVPGIIEACVLAFYDKINK